MIDATSILIRRIPQPEARMPHTELSGSHCRRINFAPHLSAEKRRLHYVKEYSRCLTRTAPHCVVSCHCASQRNVSPLRLTILCYGPIDSRVNSQSILYYCSYGYAMSANLSPTLAEMERLMT
jgi:hypothetical protein